MYPTMKAVKGHVKGVVGTLRSVKIAPPQTLFTVVVHYEGSQRPCEGGSGSITVSKDSTITEAVQSHVKGKVGALRSVKIALTIEAVQRCAP